MSEAAGEGTGDRPAGFDGARRLVVKIGSAVLSERGAAGFDRVTFASLVRDLVGLRAIDVEVVVVSSGAVALGVHRLGLTARPAQMRALQATAAVGQGRLIRMWDDELAAYGVPAAQVLLTHDDLQSRRRFLTARHTLRALLELGAVPIINENDAVAFEEIKLGDNDHLAAQIVSLIGADLMIMLSDADGLYDRHPSEPGARCLERVKVVSEAIRAMVRPGPGALGSGGMGTKLEAVSQTNQLGVPCIIAGGKTPAILRRLHQGEPLGTWFEAARGARSQLGSRKHWIAYGVRPAGQIQIDAGAARALLEQGGSLLPIGVREVCGDFGVGDPVSVLGPGGVEIARGLSGVDARTLERVRGQRSDQALLDPEISAAEVIHRDDLVLLSR